jgi:hypothetical protein
MRPRGKHHGGIEGDVAVAVGQAADADRVVGEIGFGVAASYFDGVERGAAGAERGPCGGERGSAVGPGGEHEG